MIGGAVIPVPVSAPLIRPLTGADLVTPAAVERILFPALGHGVEGGVERGAGVAQVGLPGTPGGGAHEAGRSVQHPATVLVLVAVLAALAGAGEPGDLESVVRAVERGRVADAGTGVDHRDRHGRGLDASAFFRWWNALNTMSARLVVERVGAGPADLEHGFGVAGARGRIEPAVLSTQPVGQAGVGAGEIAGE